MKNSLTVKQIQDLDKLAIEKHGVPSLYLMENAGCAVAGEVQKVLGELRNSTVVIVCGLGNNAGDGYVAARYLKKEGVNVCVFQIGSTQNLKNDAAVNYQRFKEQNGTLVELSKVNDAFLRKITDAHVVVDAIFGVGLNRSIGEPFRKFIEEMNARARSIVAVDIPSGLDGTTGKIYGISIRAQTTVTFTFAKKGFTKNDGPLYVGNVVVVDIGIPRVLLEERRKE